MHIGERSSIRLALAPEAPADRQLSYLCGTVVHKTYGNPISNAEVSVTNAFGLERTIITGAHGAFFIEVNDGEHYGIMAKKAAFHNASDSFTIRPEADQCHSIVVPLEPNRDLIPPPLTLDIKLKKGIVLELYHIYFDRGKASIREDAEEELQTFLAYMLKFPGMRGEIMAHTDSRADDAFNMRLSQQRADAVKKWLIARGIEAERLEARGYGETRLVNHCADGVECTEEQHQRNRRVEFRIIDTGDVVKSTP
jgi:outer membrane protein OmpA-like peptidoglycan-associated protein